MNETIIALQEAISHQDADIATLSAEVYAQQKEIMELKQQLAKLQNMLRQYAHELSPKNNTPEPPPPHY